MEVLNDSERKFLGLAVFSMAMKVGPSAFPVVESLVQKVGIVPEFEFYAKDWTDYAKRIKDPAPGPEPGQ